ncbi:glycosyltransferase [Egibacter rhizosphaerae]|uniref:4,4'-diaponeurosporenoate glycosyltransferase n=1 Tax=Egibacter rhizosphaerae TaxID=1670831 RepID=A0A411YGQ3_9ACTN|nr:glycosyltransferase family 2 protein [Egibacter rhizosphaerae]QBI20262.1 glycosyltransferase [Egibacter rhizosphaerae]
MTSVVVPAHNEAASIGGCLDALLPQLAPGDEVIVACNGCTDDTAAIVRARAPTARVLELATSSKIAALNAGDAAATQYPRLYMDADVQLAPGSVAAIVDALAGEDVWLAAPVAAHDLSTSSWAVRSYYRIWSRLPSVRDDTVGSGLYALSDRGRAQFDAFPDVTGDDHFVRDAVPPERRHVVTAARSTVQAPRTFAGILRRKTRTVLGNAELDRHDPRTRQRAAGRRQQWLEVVRANPILVVDLPVFLVAALWPRAIATWRRRVGSPTGWDRDNSRRPD